MRKSHHSFNLDSELVLGAIGMKKKSQRIFKSAKVKEFCEKCDRALIGVKDEE